MKITNAISVIVETENVTSADNASIALPCLNASTAIKIENKKVKLTINLNMIINPFNRT
ncbi:hypothetical protein NVP2096O_03 [Vibrio phage 2.096.O._10N.286.48.B5]|nr:hypothetical protein NVP2096O_03 [Vibrio phage 2.096.O._10N.286.48.B5]